jgi:hypothetical protein
MRKQIARLLLLFALGGNVIPLAVAATAAPAHACCLRKAAHHCHDTSSGTANQLAVRSTSCCNHDCCRAAAISQHANPLAQRSIARNCNVAIGPVEAESVKAASIFFATRSSRGPPLNVLS